MTNQHIADYIEDTWEWDTDQSRAGSGGSFTGTATGRCKDETRGDRPAIFLLSRGDLHIVRPVTPCETIHTFSISFSVHLKFCHCQVIVFLP